MRDAQRLLGATLERVTEYLGPSNPELRLHEQMLHAGLAMLQESAGMPLAAHDVRARASEVEKSLGNDGGQLHQAPSHRMPRPTTTAARSWSDSALTADRSECNGRCGPKSAARAVEHVDARLPGARRLLRRDVGRQLLDAARRVRRQVRLRADGLFARVRIHFASTARGEVWQGSESSSAPTLPPSSSRAKAPSGYASRS